LKQHVTGEEAIRASWVSLMKDDATWAPIDQL